MSKAVERDWDAEAKAKGFPSWEAEREAERKLEDEANERMREARGKFFELIDDYGYHVADICPDHPEELRFEDDVSFGVQRGDVEARFWAELFPLARDLMSRLPGWQRHQHEQKRTADEEAKREAGRDARAKAKGFANYEAMRKAEAKAARSERAKKAAATRKANAARAAELRQRLLRNTGPQLRVVNGEAA